MKTFRFPLQKAMEWRQTQLELEETRYKQAAAELARLDGLRAELEASGGRAEVEVRQWDRVGGGDLAALGGFRTRVKKETARIGEQRAAAAKTAAERQALMMQARQRCKLLERLRERRMNEWVGERDKELDELAGEAFLAGWNRRE